MLKEKKQRLEQRSISKDEPIIVAMRQMDRLDCKLLMVTKDDDYFGIVSVGDIQRAIIANSPLETKVGDILRDNLRLAKIGDPFDDIQSMMLQFRTEFMPVLDAEGGLADVYFWDDIFSSRPPNKKQINLPVVLMAGGKGTRLKPFSNVLPKPLFPMGEKTIIEMIIDRFCDVGCDNFLMSVNYKADFIRAYFNQIEDARYSIEFFEEPKPLGTAGSLTLVKDQIDRTFFVSNCDIIIDTDYSEILDYHRAHHNEITLVAAMQHHQIPYGTLETAEGGRLVSIHEKPETTHMINAGMYLIEPQVIEEIPANTFFHITHLVEAIMKRGGSVGVFPVSEKSWTDIGEWRTFTEASSRFAAPSDRVAGEYFPPPTSEQR